MLPSIHLCTLIPVSFVVLVSAFLLSHIHLSRLPCHLSFDHEWHFLVRKFAMLCRVANLWFLSLIVVSSLEDILVGKNQQTVLSSKIVGLCWLIIIILVPTCFIDSLTQLCVRRTLFPFHLWKNHDLHPHWCIATTTRDGRGEKSAFVWQMRRGREERGEFSFDLWLPQLIVLFWGALQRSKGYKVCLRQSWVNEACRN